MDKLAVEAAWAPLGTDALDWKKVDALRGHTQLLKALDSWILIADRKLIPQMIELGQLVRSLYPIPDELTIYRGFGINGFQENMGLKHIPHLGQVVHFQSDERALSFSTDLNIAKGFGNVVVTTKLQTRRSHFLDITDELSYLVQEMRNIKDFQTQREIILLPPVCF